MDGHEKVIWSLGYSQALQDISKLIFQVSKKDPKERCDEVNKLFDKVFDEKEV
jgi:hypothetical protein